MIDAAGALGAPVIIGSMQGRWGEGLERDEATFYLASTLTGMGKYAERYGVPLIYEPLNRYETNFCTTLEQGSALLDSLDTSNVKLLADLFHMNIEEADLPASIRASAKHIGHVHFADSNRRAVGGGHTAMAPIGEALREIGYSGYLSAEVFALPDSEAAARQTMESYRRFVG